MEIKKHLGEQLVNLLRRKYSEKGVDIDMDYVDIQKGSILLGVRGSPATFDRLYEDVASGKLTCVTLESSTLQLQALQLRVLRCRHDSATGKTFSCLHAIEAEQQQIQKEDEYRLRVGVPTELKGKSSANKPLPRNAFYAQAVYSCPTPINSYYPVGVWVNVHKNKDYIDALIALMKAASGSPQSMTEQTFKKRYCETDPSQYKEAFGFRFARSDGRSGSCHLRVMNY